MNNDNTKDENAKKINKKMMWLSPHSLNFSKQYIVSIRQYICSIHHCFYKWGNQAVSHLLIKTCLSTMIQLEIFNILTLL